MSTIANHVSEKKTIYERWADLIRTASNMDFLCAFFLSFALFAISGNLFWIGAYWLALGFCEICVGLRVLYIILLVILGGAAVGSFGYCIYRLKNKYFLPKDDDANKMHSMVWIEFSASLILYSVWKKPYFSMIRFKK